MPKRSQLRSVNPGSAPAPQGAAVSASGDSVEVMPKASKRRSFSAAEKLRILREADGCTERGDVAALLRREGIYSSHLHGWRAEVALHGTESLGTKKRGRPPKYDAKDRRIAELEKVAARLQAKLSLAEKLLDLQKKVSVILGIELGSGTES